MKCPDCDGPMWDNRDTKRGNQPDFKCKDRDCNGAKWLQDDEDGGDRSAPRSRAVVRGGNGLRRFNGASKFGGEDYEARQRMIVRQHSQEMALKYLQISGVKPETLKELTAMTDYFFKDAMGAVAPAAKKPKPAPEPEVEEDEVPF